ncbi:MAG: hypothetical protein KIT31_43205, partial [Deltaproteobacteria bacterium]|nr:hypothetical protein [Deltaproteobacteria bacterium]
MRSLAVAGTVAALAALVALAGPAAAGVPRRERAALIRDTAAAAGMTNAALLAGIGEVETNLAHCWSEATWACKGPASPSCGGGPVIAGAADGPCADEQGGLGMFQFDAGTYAQTLATYGPDIVTLEGNAGAVIPFLVPRAIESVDGITDEAGAIAWMNSIAIADGDPPYEAWLYFVAWRYNGCKGCASQIEKYRRGTSKLRDELGPDFWAGRDDGGCASTRGTAGAGIAIAIALGLLPRRRRRG